MAAETRNRHETAAFGQLRSCCLGRAKLRHFPARPLKQLRDREISDPRFDFYLVSIVLGKGGDEYLVGLHLGLSSPLIVIVFAAPSCGNLVVSLCVPGSSQTMWFLLS